MERKFVLKIDSFKAQKDFIARVTFCLVGFYTV